MTGEHNSHALQPDGAIISNCYFHCTTTTSKVPWKQSVMQSHRKDGCNRDSLAFPNTMDYMEFSIQGN